MQHLLQLIGEKIGFGKMRSFVNMNRLETGKIAPKFRVNLVAKLAVVLPLLALMLLAACEKEPGKGGLATIKGKVYVWDVNALGQVHDSGYGGGVKVMLSYGANEWVDQSNSTSPDGTYAFQGLQKGTYRVQIFSRCDTCLLNQETFALDVEITETRQVATLPDFKIKE